MVTSWDLIETEQINMNNLYKRPMFRKGGSAQGGITSGLQAPRQGYATNENNLVQQGDTSKLGKVQSELALLNQLAPAPQRPQSTAMNDFLINFGLNMASASPTGNILLSGSRGVTAYSHMASSGHMLVMPNIFSGVGTGVMMTVKNQSTSDGLVLSGSTGDLMFGTAAGNLFLTTGSLSGLVEKGGGQLGIYTLPAKSTATFISREGGGSFGYAGYWDVIDECEIASTKDATDTAFAYGVGAGLDIYLTEFINKDTQSNNILSLILSSKYLWGGEVKYLKEGGITVIPDADGVAFPTILYNECIY